MKKLTAIIKKIAIYTGIAYLAGVLVTTLIVLMGPNDSKADDGKSKLFWGLMIGLTWPLLVFKRFTKSETPETIETTTEE